MKQLFLLLPLLLLGCTEGNTYFLETHTTPADFGELYGLHSGEVNIISSGVYYNVSNLTSGHMRGITNSNSSLNISKSGYYAVVSQFSFSDGANKEFHLSIGVNGVRQQNCHTERKVGGVGDVGSGSVTCILLLNSSDCVTSMIENPVDTANPTLHGLNLNLVEII